MNKENTTSVYFFKVYLQVVVTPAFSPSTQESRDGQTPDFEATWVTERVPGSQGYKEKQKTKTNKKETKQPKKCMVGGLERRFSTRESSTALQRTKVWFPASHRAPDCPQPQLLRI